MNFKFVFEKNKNEKLSKRKDFMTKLLYMIWRIGKNLRDTKDLEKANFLIYGKRE